MAERITAMDIESRDFKRRMRGYDEDEVQLFLKSVADEVQRINLENLESREALGQARTRIVEYEKHEKALQDALIATQRFGDELVEKSRAEADLLVREARLTSERMLQQAQDQLERIEDEIRRAQLERSDFERQLRASVEHHLELLELRARGREGEEPQVEESGDNLHVLPRVTGKTG
jgi:cell division initiation protein